MSRVLIYRRKPSPSAVRLAEELRLRGVEALKVRRVPRDIRPDDFMVYWGETGLFYGLNQKNRIPNKLEELQVLKAAGVPTVDFYAPGDGDWPNRPLGVWYPRTLNHSGGRDFLARDGDLDAGYWVRREEFVSESRVHIWRGLSIRAGIKVPVPGEASHDWVRSRGCGWRVAYTGVSNDERELAKRGVAALGLDFGAVDIATRMDGNHIILEVNRAPGLEGQTVVKYADKIEEEMNGRSSG